VLKTCFCAINKAVPRMQIPIGCLKLNTGFSPLRHSDRMIAEEP
jgi:hypothetical protein